MTDLNAVLANPLGLDGFEFCEFTSPFPETLARQFEALGFVPVIANAGPGAITH